MPQQPLHEVMSPGQAYFDVYGDRDKMRTSCTPESDEPLTWRGDPLNTGSDYTIVVVTSELQTQSYHVHKSILCFGARQSKFFNKIMMKKGQGSNKSQRKKGKTTSSDATKIPTVKVELDQKDAENFPIFLDFHYAAVAHGDDIPSIDTLETAASSGSASSNMLAQSKSGDSCGLVEGDDILTTNSVSLRLLARRFENDALMKVVNKFIQKDLNFQTGPVYLYQAWEYHDERLMESARRLCAENIKQIDPKALLRLPIDLFRVVVKSLESFEEDNKELSLFLSEVVCWYLEQHPQARSAELLLELTDPLLMPFIASEAGIGYTAVVKDLDPEDAIVHWDKLVRLCQRCAKTVVREYGWSDFSVNSAVSEYLGRSRHEEQTPVDSLLFATSFAAALEQAQDDYEEMSIAQSDFERIISVLNASTTSLESVADRKDKYIEKQQAVIESSEAEILNLKRQLDGIKKQQKQQEVAEGIRKREQQQILTEMKRIHQMELQDQKQRQFQKQQPPPFQQQHSAHQSHHPNFQQQNMRQQPRQQHIVDSRRIPEEHWHQRRQTPERSRQPTIHSTDRSLHESKLTLPNPRLKAPQRGPHYSPPPMARHRHCNNEYTTSSSHERPDLLEMNIPPPPPQLSSSSVKELVSPASVGMDVHRNKSERREELRTKNEMRNRSLLS